MTKTKTHIRQLADFDLQFLQEVATLIDRRLVKLDKKTKSVSDPDGSGLLDTWDATAGLGFVACQNYLSAVIGRNKKGECLALGPKHPKGDAIAAIINAGANYAKHHPEERLHDPVVEILRRMGIWKHNPDRGCERAIDYPLGNLLFEMLTPTPSRFRNVLPLLEKWRDAVIEAGLG